MMFLSPQRLWLTAAVALLAVAYVVLQRRRRHYAVRFTNLDLLASVAPRRPGWRRHVAAALTGLGLLTLVVALARPVREEQVPRDRAVVMLVMDVSGSMMATDIAPNRLTAAQEAAADFVRKTPPAYQVGLVAFDGVASVHATPTTDHGAVVNAIQRLTAGGATATGDGVQLALSTIEAAVAQPVRPGQQAPPPPEDVPGSIVLLSDGATTAGTPLSTATAAAAEKGVPVTTIAYGTPDGRLYGSNGASVHVPADEESMRAVAQATGGSFFTAGSAGELANVYDAIQSKIGHVLEQREVLRFFLGLGILLLVLGTVASMVWSARFL